MRRSASGLDLTLGTLGGGARTPGILASVGSMGNLAAMGGGMGGMSGMGVLRSAAASSSASAAAAASTYMCLRTFDTPVGALFFEFRALASRLWKHYNPLSMLATLGSGGRYPARPQLFDSATAGTGPRTGTSGSASAGNGNGNGPKQVCAVASAPQCAREFWAFVQENV